MKVWQCFIDDRMGLCNIGLTNLDLTLFHYVAYDYIEEGIDDEKRGDTDLETSG